VSIPLFEHIGAIVSWHALAALKYILEKYMTAWINCKFCGTSFS